MSITARPPARGFSILEALVASFVLTLILMTLLNLLPASLLAVGHARHVLTATAMARSMLEERRSAGFSLFDVAPPLTPVTDDGTTFTPQFEVVDVSSQAHPNLTKGIRVTVLWEERGQVRSLAQEMWLCNVPR